MILMNYLNWSFEFWLDYSAIYSVSQRIYLFFTSTSLPLSSIGAVTFSNQSGGRIAGSFLEKCKTLLWNFYFKKLTFLSLDFEGLERCTFQVPLVYFVTLPISSCGASWWNCEWYFTCQLRKFGNSWINALASTFQNHHSWSPWVARQIKISIQSVAIQS